CNSCHSVFPRLNQSGEDYLRNGYQLASSRRKAAPSVSGREQAVEGESENGNSKGVFIESVNNLFGFRLNMTPVMMETHSLQKKAPPADKDTRLTVGSPLWIQMFVAGSIYRDISFFSELEYAQSAFKFNWFYFNFTNVADSRGLNFQVGNISPLEFASYPNRLPQLPNIKGEVMLIKSSNGAGEESIDMSSARPGVQYYGRNDWALVYAGMSPGTKATDVNQFPQYWTGLVLRATDVAGDFEGTTATVHYYMGTDTKGTGTATQIENKFTRISPQVNIRYYDQVDVQAAYVFGKDKNRGLVTTPATEFKYKGVALEGGYMPRRMVHLGLHYDKYSSDNKLASGKPVIEYHRIVPAVTYVINQNFRASVYYEKNLLDIPSAQKVDKLYLNLRTMF
ncbi:MAG: hypothetical protein HY710_07215, partial [Candidatus Latescibacteria bacterium]|nr:hypothetical protein [Candidatus Latescibacterota bacterium]